MLHTARLSQLLEQEGLDPVTTAYLWVISHSLCAIKGAVSWQAVGQKRYQRLLQTLDDVYIVAVWMSSV